MQLKAKTVEECRPLAEQLLKQWLAIRKYLRLALSNEPITREQDHEFLQVKSQISKHYSQLRIRLPKQLLGTLEVVQDVMKQALSVTHLRNLPTTDQRQVANLWHGYYVDLCRMAGALKFMTEEKYYPKIEDKQIKASGNIKADLKSDLGK
jgi:hypothetical protein